MKILSFGWQSRAAFIHNFMTWFKPAGSQTKLPKITECQFVNQPFTVIEQENCFIVEAKGMTVRKQSTWTVADWVYKALMIKPHEDDFK